MISFPYKEVRRDNYFHLNLSKWKGHMELDKNFYHRKVNFYKWKNI